MSKQQQKVAIVHDWLYGGGAELVVEQLHLMYPDAPIYASYCSDEWRKRLDNKVITGFLQKWPFNKLRKFIPFLRIWWFTHLDLTEYDLVISSSGAEAKGIKVPKSTLHINYCHAPTHYYWSRYEEYMEHPGMGRFDWLARLGLKLLITPLKRWDFTAAQRPDVMIANSTHIQQEIQRYYKRTAQVVFPPVYFERFQENKSNKKTDTFIIAGRQTPYKRFDLAIQACSQTNIPLNVIGDGPDNARLRSLAGPSVTFLGKLSDTELEKEFSRAKALIFPGLDDFGITPVEALAAGTPVIAYKAGGALDYITPGKTGEFFSEQSVESLNNALIAFDSESYDSNKLKTHAKIFSRQAFQKNMTKIIIHYYK